jgi:hypothetical protein
MSDGILDDCPRSHGQPALDEGALGSFTPDLELVAESPAEDRAVVRGRSRGAREVARTWQARAEAAQARADAAHQRAEAAQAEARQAVELAVSALAEADGLRRAMASRSDIDMAKGILMARLGITADSAFALLVQSSQRKHLRVADVARLLVQQPGGGHAAMPAVGRRRPSP